MRANRINSIQRKRSTSAGASKWPMANPDVRSILGGGNGSHEAGSRRPSTDQHSARKLDVTPSRSSEIRRICSACQTKNDAGPLAPATESKIQNLGQGTPLPASERSFFESRFGANFSQVRIHTNAEADQASRSLNAQAFTLGDDIAFAHGEYQPGTSRGRNLLAHELTHTLQQTSHTTVQPRRRRRVRRPKLSLYQVDSAAATHFRAKAKTKAGEIGAISLDTSNSCPNGFETGPSAYRSGQDIIELIAKAYWCTGEQIRELHIFSHGFVAGGGVVASDDARKGLVSSDVHLSQQHREDGARRASELQVEPFANNALIVLHGCQIGAGDNSFAEQVFRHLVGDRPGVRVFAHYDSGVCGRDIRWREFNESFPDGRRRTRLPDRQGRRGSR